MRTRTSTDGGHETALENRVPAVMLYPGLAVTLTVLGGSLVADGPRDLLDPRLTR